jgi:diacylglycerol kinase (ATP)
VEGSNSELGKPPKKFLKKPRKHLPRMIKQFLKCSIKYLDIWDVQVECYPEGGIQTVQKVKKKNGKLKNKLQFLKKSGGSTTSNGGNQLVLRRKMSNYCSLGIDAKIGLRFEMKRTSSRFRNKMMYAYEGAKRFFSKQKRLKSFVEKMEVLNSGQTMA